MKTTLHAYHNNKSIKQQYVKRIHCHKIADELIHGTYWENGKGCAIGCILHSSNHKKFETELGLPEWLAYLVDHLFESLPNGQAKEFPEQVLKSIKVGVNLDKTYHKFCIFLLTDMCKDTDHPLVKSAIDQVLDYHRTVLKTGKEDSAARSAARSAAGSARSAARSAESAAWSAWSAWSAARSAWSAARSAWSAVGSARSAAGSAARSAWSAVGSAAGSAAESAAWSAAESAAYQKIANKLIELLKEAK